MIDEIEKQKQQEIENEKKQWKAFKASVVRMADKATPFKNWGDGNYGSVIEMILDELEKKGLDRTSSSAVLKRRKA